MESVVALFIFGSLIILLLPLLFGLLYVVPSTITFWILYNKAKQPGWALLIPYYGQYIYFKLAQMLWFFWLSIVIGVVGFVILAIVGLSQGQTTTQSSSSRSGISSDTSSSYYTNSLDTTDTSATNGDIVVRNSDGSIRSTTDPGPFVFVLIPVLIFGIVLMIIAATRFARNYDRSVGFWLLVYLVPIVAVFIVRHANFNDHPHQGVAAPDGRISDEELRSLGLPTSDQAHLTHGNDQPQTPTNSPVGVASVPAKPYQPYFDLPERTDQAATISAVQPTRPLERVTATPPQIAPPTVGRYVAPDTTSTQPAASLYNAPLDPVEPVMPVSPYPSRPPQPLNPNPDEAGPNEQPPTNSQV